MFSIALKACEIGNERRSITLRKHENRFRFRPGTLEASLGSLRRYPGLTVGRILSSHSSPNGRLRRLSLRASVRTPTPRTKS